MKSLFGKPLIHCISPSTLLSQLYNKHHLTKLCVTLPMISSSTNQEHHTILALYHFISSAVALSGLLGSLLYLHILIFTSCFMDGGYSIH